MKKPVNFFQSLLKSANEVPGATLHNPESITPFEEREKQLETDSKNGLCAYSLFSAFTADIIKENTLFTR